MSFNILFKQISYRVWHCDTSYQLRLLTDRSSHVKCQFTCPTSSVEKKPKILSNEIFKTELKEVFKKYSTFANTFKRMITKSLSTLTLVTILFVTSGHLHRELMNIIKITNEYNQDTQFLISFHQHGELLSMLMLILGSYA